MSRPEVMRVSGVELPTTVSFFLFGGHGMSSHQPSHAGSLGHPGPVSTQPTMRPATVTAKQAATARAARVSRSFFIELPPRHRGVQPAWRSPCGRSERPSRRGETDAVTDQVQHEARQGLGDCDLLHGLLLGYRSSSMSFTSSQRSRRRWRMSRPSRSRVWASLQALMSTSGSMASSIRELTTEGSRASSSHEVRP